MHNVLVNFSETTVDLQTSLQIVTEHFPGNAHYHTTNALQLTI